MALSIGDSMPEIALPGTDGREYRTADITGDSATLIMFWCNHCPYVVANQDRIIRLQAEFAPRGVKFAAISANDIRNYPEDSLENMAKRAREKGYNFPYLYDESQQFARACGAQRTPEMFLFDAAGKLCYRGRVDDNYEDESHVRSHDLRNALEAVLEGRPCDPDETGALGCTIKWK